MSSDGLSLAVETWGDGQPLVFSPGLTNTRIQALLLLEPLMDHYRLIGFDQRGHGDSSPVTDPALYDPELMAADIDAVMDTLGIERAVVGGESMGSATALLFALRRPERVEALLLVAPAFSHEPNPGRELVRELGRKLATPQRVEAYIAAAARGEWRTSGLDDRAIDTLSGYLRAHRPESLRVACEAVADWVILGSLDELRALRCPVHIVAWEGDVIHPVALAHAMVAETPDASLAVLPGPAAVFNDMPSVGRTFAGWMGRAGPNNG